MTIGAAIVVLALVLFLILRPGLALLLVVIGAAVIAAFIGSLEKQTAKRVADAEQAKQLALSAIKPSDLSLRDVTLEGSILKGTITNNSKYPLKYIEFEVTITDCQKSEGPSTNNCQTVGQTSVGKSLPVPATQTREFSTTALTFQNMPKQKRCWDDAPSTASDTEAYNEGFVRGRRFLHPKLGFTFEAPEDLRLQNNPDMILGLNNSSEQALRLEIIHTPKEQTLSDYLNSGWIKGVDPTTVNNFSVNDLPAATVVATDIDYKFRLYVVRFNNDVYRFIFATKRITPEIDLAFRNSISSFRRMTATEMACDTVRSFAWKLMEIEAAGFGN